MPKILFDISGTLKVAGVVVSEGEQVEIELDGDVIASGCAEKALIEAIGIKSIVDILGNDEVLSKYSVDELIDHIVNSERSDAFKAYE